MTDGDKASLQYERPGGGGISRWQFRLLLALVVANLAITVQSAYAPGTGAAIKKWWVERQATRKMQALYRQAATWTQPAGKVVWDENPESAAKLLAGQGYRPVAVSQTVRLNYPYLSAWPNGAAATPPDFPRQLFRNFPVGRDGRLVQPNEEYALLLMHALKSPSGQERLVYVFVVCGMDVSANAPDRSPGGPTTPFSGVGRKRLQLFATPCLPPVGANFGNYLREEAAELRITPRHNDSWPHNQSWPVPFDWIPGGDASPPQVKLHPVNQFRFYAGQLDPADPSHFTIDYELDGRKGTIHGRLKDDGSVQLQPDGGIMNGPYWTPPGNR